LPARAACCGMKNKWQKHGAGRDAGVRLHKFIAQCGVASRRKAEEMMAEGRVTVNGKMITEPGFKINPGRDFVKVDNKPVKPEKKIYIVLNKPEGCVTTASDEKGRGTVLDLIKGVFRERLFPVGRLDYNTTGCLIMTNDGEWANRITHPKFEVEKEYTAKIQGRLDADKADRLVKGVTIGTTRVRAKRAGIKEKNEKNDIIYIVITGGMYHQVKDMLMAVGLSAVRLKRDRIGDVNVKGIEPGQWRHLTEDEIDYFNRGQK
jgi:pseudouridine synthase